MIQHQQRLSSVCLAAALLLIVYFHYMMLRVEEGRCSYMTGLGPVLVRHEQEGVASRSLLAPSAQPRATNWQSRKTSSRIKLALRLVAARSMIWSVK